jgi:hypothetical protein
MEYNAKRLILETIEAIKGPFSTDFSEGVVTNLSSLPALLRITTTRLPPQFR